MMNRTIFTKYGRRAFSAMASSRLSSSVKDAWKEQKGLGLFKAFLTGYSGHILFNLYKRREYWHKIDRTYDEAIKRADGVNAKLVEFQKAHKEAMRVILNGESTS
ncbi:PREDICTED: uncharacterized protein LOC104721258 [Camelina sativa]|uniref:Uncharacterized protein LOC104721258 n=1 Tax=Camelina sativa TaxID=90675 RepID=A0ABM0U8G5_CAMSA|nr:PREDICTED: uncharacterized protein LOC104721258 [Camelina sativa]